MCNGQRRLTAAFLGAILANICASYHATAAECGSASLYSPACCHEVERAGCPNQLSCLASVQNPCIYTGYYVGGSECSHCNARCGNQGTWGWDYSGRIFHR